MPLLTEEEARYYLGVGEDEIRQLIKKGKLTAYRLGGAYLRFKKEEVLALKSGRKFVAPEELGRSAFDKFIDFWKFYSFYILSSVLVLLLAFYFFQL